MRASASRHGWHRWWKRGKWWIIGVLLLLVVLRLSLAPLVKTYVNRQLNRSKDYGGKIGKVDIQLWRGQYRIHSLEISKRTGDIQTPFFTAARLDLAIEWRELFHRALVGEVVLHQPQLNFVSGPTPEQTQTGKEESWNKTLESLFPFKLNRFEIERGQIHFQNHYSTPPVDIYLKDLAVTATNLSNSRDLHTDLPAGVVAHGSTLGGGGLDFDLHLNPLAAAPTYQFTAALTNADLVGLNDFLRAYGKFDVERGTFALYSSFASKEGNYEGYFKVFFQNLDVFAWEKERQKNILKIFWQAVVGTIATIFENHSKDTLAAKVPVSGSYQGNKVGVWTAVATVLQNAFVSALLPKLDEQETVAKVQQKLEHAKDNNPPDPQPSPSVKGASKLGRP